MKRFKAKGLAAVVALAAAGNASAFSFGPYQTLATGSWAEEVAIGDLNADGRNDLVLITSYYFDPQNDNRVFVYLQNAQGNLDPPQKTSFLSSGIAQSASLALADMNNDGRLDVIVGHNGGLSILTTQANGGLVYTNAIAGTRATVLAISDVNLDGNADIASLHWNEGLTIYLGNGNGGVASQSTVPTIAQGYNDMEFGDLNGDGYEDLAIMSGQGLGPALAVYYHNGVSALGTGTVIPTVGTNSRNNIAVGDFNQDGRDDLALTRGGNSGTVVEQFLQNNAGQLVQGTTLSSYQIPGAAAAADLDHDGDDDLAVVHDGWTNLGVYLQSGSMLGPEALYFAPNGSHSTANSLVLGDINSDQCEDAVVTNDTAGFVRLYGQDCFVADSVPNPFAFQSLNSVSLNTVQESQIQVVQGINVATSISVTGGEYRIEGGAYTTAPGIVSSGQSVQVRHVSANTFGTTTTTALTIGGVIGTFSSTTINADATPDPFTLIDQTGLATNTVAVSQAVTINGINVPTPIAVTGGEYSINGGAFTAVPGNISNGNAVRVRITSASAANATTQATLTIGGISDTFSVTTGSGDSTPNAFTLVDQVGVKKSKWITSNVITVSGINLVVNASVSGTNIRWSKNGGAYSTTIGTVANGDQVRVQMKSSDTAFTPVTGTLTIGGVSANWTVTSGGT